MPEPETSPPPSVELSARDYRAEYLAAVAEEATARDFAFLDLPRDVCGIPLKQMTLRHLLVRLMIGCPFFGGDRIPGAEDVANFLWHLSTEFVPVKPGVLEPTNFWRWLLIRILPRLNRRAVFVRKIIFPNGPTAERVRELKSGIREYIDWTFYDAPATTEGGSVVAFTSFVAGYLDVLGNQYDWSAISDRPALDTPLVVIYQLIRKLQKRNDPENAVFVNRKSDKVRGDYYAAKNRNAPVPPRPPDSASTSQLH